MPNDRTGVRMTSPDGVTAWERAYNEELDQSGRPWFGNLTDSDYSKALVANRDGLMRCPSCDGSAESEHWTSCYLCIEEGEALGHYKFGFVTLKTFREWQLRRDEADIARLRARGYRVATDG